MEFLTVDIEHVTATMERLKTTIRENNKALRSAFGQVGTIIQTSVRKGAKSISKTNTKERQKSIFKTVYKRDAGVVVGIHKVVKLPSESNRKFSYLWVELPTSTTTGRNGRKHKGTPAHPFFSRAVESALPKAETKLTELIEKQLTKAASKRK